MRMRFILVALVAIVIGLCTYLLVHWVSYEYIEEVYSSDERKKTREESYVDDLQSFINRNKLTADNATKLSEWAKENKYVYLIIYNGNEEFYTSDDLINFSPPEEPEKNPQESPETKPDNTEKDPKPDPEPENPAPEEPDPENPEPEDPDAGDEEPDPEDPDTESDDKDSTETDKDSTETDKDGEKTDGANEDNTTEEKQESTDQVDYGGVTVSYPTRDQLFEYAKNNDLHMLRLTDGTEFFVSLTEFTEYLYYDVTNISGIAFAIIVALVMLILYYQILATRIIHLGQEVDKVAAGDITYEIKSGGDDEIGRLSQNVNNMRVSMIANFEKEREALEANSALITSMSHDIRTPLTVLLGYIDVMQKKMQGDEDMQGYLKAAESTAMRLKNLSDDMFGYFLVFGSKGADLDLDSYDAATLIDQMILEHVMLMRERGYSVDFDLLDYEALDGKELRTDAPKLMRILDNIFSNLYKYSDKSYPVIIEVTQTDSEMCVRVSNRIATLVDKVESNKIGLKTCEKLAEYLGAKFEHSQSDDTFVAALTLKLYNAQ